MQDDELVAELDGDFAEGHVHVNGTRLHYVAGGDGPPLVLLGGWPRTWWEFHKVMPALARERRVIAVELRGMGASAKPWGGYEKKNMARDIAELIGELGYERVDVLGHDIGLMVAFHLTAGNPELVDRLVLLDVVPPNEGFNDFRLIPNFGQLAELKDGLSQYKYPWWFSFNQVPGLPEQLLAGRMRYLIDWMIDYQAVNRTAISERDRRIYAEAYDEPEAIRAGNAWYQAFRQDVEDLAEYSPLRRPTLAIPGKFGEGAMRAQLAPLVEDIRFEVLTDSGHYVPEEQPEALVELVEGFLSSR